MLVGFLFIEHHSTETSSDQEFELTLTVDKKLSEISDQLVRYFSTLSSQKDNEILTFQQTIFLSLLQDRHADDFFNIYKQTDASVKEDTISEIFRELRIPENKAKRHIERYFNQLRRLRQEDDSKNQKFSLDQLYSILNMQHIRDLVDEWQRLEGRLAIIFEQRDQFVDIVIRCFKERR